MASFSDLRAETLSFSGFNLGGRSRPAGVDFYPETQTVFWTDRIDGSIRSVFLNGTNPQLIADTYVQRKYIYKGICNLSD